MWWDEVLRDDAWECPIGTGMTIVEEISFAGAQATSSITRLAALARNDKVAMFRMIVEVLAWGTVVAAGGFVIAAADGGMKDVAVVIDVECETAGAFASWTGVTG